MDSPQLCQLATERQARQLPARVDEEFQTLASLLLVRINFTAAVGTFNLVRATISQLYEIKTSVCRCACAQRIALPVPAAVALLLLLT